MKVSYLRVTNIKAIKSATVIPTGSIVKIGGPNESGKTTLLDCIKWLFESGKKMDENSLRLGAEKGVITAKLEGVEEEVHIERVITDSGTRIRCSVNGESLKSPQEFLERLASPLLLDPMAFVNATPSHQANMLFHICSTKMDKAALQNQTGLEPLAGESNEAYFGRCYNACLERLRDAKAKAGDLAQQERELEALPMDDIKKLSPIDVAATVQERNAAYDVLCKANADLSHRLKLSQEIDVREAELREMRHLLTTLPEHTDAFIENCESRILALDETIKNADRTNHLCRQYEAYKEVVKQKAEACNAVDTQSELRDGLLAYRRECIRETLDMDGIDVDAKSIMLHGVPLAQRGASVQMLVGLQFGAALNPKARIILIKNGNLLDAERRAKLEEWATENDYQVFEELVQEEKGGVTIFMENGEALSVQ